MNFGHSKKLWFEEQRSDAASKAWNFSRAVEYINAAALFFFRSAQGLYKFKADILAEIFVFKFNLFHQVAGLIQCFIKIISQGGGAENPSTICNDGISLCTCACLEGHAVFYFNVQS